jgi:3-oxoacyl-ACP reductase-like protein
MLHKEFINITMTTHILRYVFQPVEAFFAWSLTEEQISSLSNHIKIGVTDYCVLPFDETKESGLAKATFTMTEEEGEIKRMYIEFQLVLKPYGNLQEVQEDIEKRLKVIEQLWENRCVFCDPSMPPLYNPPQVFLDPPVTS